MTPIATIIQNNNNIARFATWTGSVKTWLPANGTVEVPFDVWSVCDKKQREALKAAISARSVSLALKILKPGGNYEIVPYFPSDVAAAPVMPPAVQQIMQPQAVKQEPPAPVNPNSGKTYTLAGDGSHIVIAKGKGANDLAKGFGIKMQEIKQPGGDVEDDLEDAVAFNNDVINAPEEQKKEAAEEPAQEEAAPEEPADEEPAKQEPDDAFITEVNNLLAAKDYEEAHKLLVEWFGEDKITFKASALRYTKTFDAVVKKYNLE